MTAKCMQRKKCIQNVYIERNCIQNAGNLCIQNVSIKKMMYAKCIHQKNAYKMHTKNVYI